MARIYNSITELVGHTPIVEFKKLEAVLGLKGRIAGKLEYFNPAGSHKDRIALEIIEAAEERGDIKPGETTLVEFTSGNTGIALAAFAAAKGYKFKIGLQPGVSVERLKLLEAYNAEIADITPEDLAPVYEKGVEAFGELTEKLLAEIENGYATWQLSNPDNVAAHYKHTGPEIWEDTDGAVDVFVAEREVGPRRAVRRAAPPCGRLRPCRPCAAARAAGSVGRQRARSPCRRGPCPRPSRGAGGRR